MILSHQEIRALIAEKQSLEGSDPNCVGPASYELRIGSFRQGQTTIPLNEGEDVAITPGGFVLLGTMEKINFDNTIAGTLVLKSSFGRQGLMSWSQGFVDPGYSGKLTIALHNLSGALFPISGGQKICHLIFMKLNAPTELGYAGPYKGSMGATPAAKSRGLITIIGEKVVGAISGGVASGLTRSALE